MKNDKGYILAAVLGMTLMVMIIGAAAIKMSEIGSLTYGSEKKYEIAGSASEYAMNAALNHITQNSTCPAANDCTGTANIGGVTANYSCFTVSAGSQCYIVAKGSFGAAKVVKTGAVPTDPAAFWAALVMNSGTLALGGSGTVSFCETGCSSGGPAVVYKDSSTSVPAGTTKLPGDCKSNEKGLIGYPPSAQNASLPADLASVYFESSSFSDLVIDLRTKYQVDDASLTALSSSCKYTGASACATTSTTNIRCDAGGAGETDINLTTCPRVYIPNADVTISQNLNSKTIYSGAKVTVTGSTTDVNVFANTLDINLDGADVAGGVFYSASSAASTTTNNVYVKSNATLGSASKPILYLSNGGTTFDSNGGPDIYGLIYTKSSAIQVNGNIFFKGSFIDDNTATITFGGNASIQFNKTVLETLKTNLGTILKAPSCSTRQTASYLSKSKITAY